MCFSVALMLYCFILFLVAFVVFDLFLFMICFLFFFFFFGGGGGGFCYLHRNHNYLDQLLSEPRRSRLLFRGFHSPRRSVLCTTPATS